MNVTWKPFDSTGHPAKRDLPDNAFAFPRERKEPLTDAAHVRNAIARFGQVTGVTDAERELAYDNIKKAAAYYGVTFAAGNWHEIGKV